MVCQPSRPTGPSALMTVEAPQDWSPAPAWLVSSKRTTFPSGSIGRQRKVSFVERTLTGGVRILRQTMFSEDMARQSGALQRVDPRVKIIAVVVLLVSTALLHHLWMILSMYVLTLALAAMSAVPLGAFVRRVWMFVPIFTGIVVLPATLSIITPGDIVWTWWSWDGRPVGVTSQGLTAAGLVVSRVATSVSLVVLLTLTTPWVRLLAALRSLGVPRMFVLIIGMAYRYIFLLLNVVTDMYEARKSRSAGAATYDRAARRFVGFSAGAVFLKAHYLSEEVYQAMIARGYRGEARTLVSPRVRPADMAFLLFAVAVAVVVYGVDRELGR